MSNKNEGGIGGVIVGIFLLIFLFSWLNIPSKKSELTGFDIASLTFANGIFVGWADNIAVKLFHSDSSYEKERATDAFREAILLGEEKYGVLTTVFNLLGAFLSIGGVVAVWLARTASSKGEAFKLGFGAEIGESVAYHIGYHTTVGEGAVTQAEVGITLIVALIMGIVAMLLNKH